MDPRDYKVLLRQTVLLPAVLIALLAAILLFQVHSLSTKMRSVQHSDAVASESRQFLRAALDMESGLRGYLLTNDRRFLEPYFDGDPVAKSSLERLKTLTAGDPTATTNVAILQERFESWRQHTQQVLANRPTRGSAAELQEHLEGKRRMDAVRQARDTILNQIEAQRTQRSSALRLGTRYVMIILIAVSTAVAAVIGFVTHRRMSALLEHYTTLLSQERKHTAEVQEAREWLLTTLRSIGDGVISADADGRIAFMNSVAEDITGWRRLSAIGAPLSRVLSFLDATSHESLPDLPSVVRDSRSPITASELLLRRKDGKTITVEQSVAPITNAEGTLAGLVLVMRDTTERHRHEDALRSSERLALLGRLSATIAHEIRNPLEAVTNLLFLMHSTKLDSDGHNYLNAAEEEVHRISQTTSQLLGFSREGRSATEVDLRQVIDGVISLFAPKLQNAGIAVSREYAGQALIKGLPGELRQVFSNLIANAIDAQPHGGTIRVRMSSDRDWSDNQRRGVRIMIADTGPGIPDSVQPSLFTAFFTTKGEKGTGLGLWVSRGIVLKHHGTMRVRSRTEGPHHGTTFNIFLPTESAAVREKVAV